MVSPASSGSRQPDARERALAWGVAALTVAAPLAIGGTPVTAQVVLSAAALALLLAYALVRRDRGLRPVPFSGLAALALAFTVLQVVPLPAALVGFLSPQAYSLRQDVAPHASWMPLTLDVPATLLACTRGIGCVSLLVVTGGLMRARRHSKLLLAVVALTATGLALVAALQRASGTTAILGFYRPRSTPGFGVFATFVDVNHAASLLALGALVAAGIAAGTRGRARGLFAACAIVSTAALLFTTSRGALLGFGIGAFLLTAILASRSIGAVPAVIAAIVLSLVGVAATLWASEGLRHRFASHQGELAHNQKTRGWADGMRMAAEYRWTGVGRGAFEAPVNAYRSSDEGVRLVYPENILVEMASEWGIALALALIVMALVVAGRLTPALVRGPPPIVGAACGVVAVVIHELTDFGLEFPGVAFPTMVTLAVVVGRLTIDERRKRDGRRISLRGSLPLVAAAAGIIALAGHATSHTLDQDFASLRQPGRPIDPVALDAAIERHPADDFLELMAAEYSYKNKRSDAMHHLNRALRLHPANWQAHRMAALLLVSMDRPSQAALEYRLALETGMGLDARELGRVLRGHVVDAVPQVPQRLIELARGLYTIGLVAEADAAALRAVELSESRQPMLMTRVQLALDGNVPAIAGRAARGLLAEADSVEAFALAARGLARASAIGEANAAIESGLKHHPNDGSLLLVGAELRLAFNDFAGARAILARTARATLTLAERQQAEDLLADVAEHSGDKETAVLARARSRLIVKQLQDMTLSGKTN
jgi:O-antigen ligase/tetratricopeptide (TPR) repeat protein